MTGRLEEQAQDESKATVWPKRRPSDGRIRPEMHPDEVDRMVRAVTHPYPGAFYDADAGRIRVWAGKPAIGPPARGVYRIPLRMGAFDAIEFDVEPLS